jgi:hypothetical protein
MADEQELTEEEFPGLFALSTMREGYLREVLPTAANKRRRL